MASVRVAARSHSWVLCLAVGLVSACNSEVPDYTTDEDTGSTHAIVTVQRTQSTDLDDGDSAEGFAQFASVPAHADPARALRAAGVLRELPQANECASTEELNKVDGPLSLLGPIEFLEAGDVALSASGLTTNLAAHAFPTVAGFASGVVYATPDRSQEALPSGAAYVITTNGSSVFPALRIQADAPETPSGVTINGQPLADVTEISAHKPMDVTWTVGQSADLVYVELGTSDGASGMLCAFADEEGAGSIGTENLSFSGPVRLSFHRARVSTAQTSKVAAELRFDFETAGTVEFVE